MHATDILTAFYIPESRSYNAGKEKTVYSIWFSQRIMPTPDYFLIARVIGLTLTRVVLLTWCTSHLNAVTYSAVQFSIAFEISVWQFICGLHLEEWLMGSVCLRSVPLSGRLRSVPLSGRLRSVPLSSRLRSVPLSSRLRSVPLSGRLRSVPLSSRLRSVPLSSRLRSVPLYGRLRSVPLSSRHIFW